MANRKGTKEQTNVHKILHRKLKIGKRKSHFKPSNYTILWNMSVFLTNTNNCLNRYWWIASEYKQYLKV
jgi:hypothetical protein